MVRAVVWLVNPNIAMVAFYKLPETEIYGNSQLFNQLG
jgi:hypothetical protein